MPMEFDPQVPSPKRRGRRALSYVPKAWGWISSRRTSRAIAANTQAITAITAVAATGVAGYGVVQAKDAQHAVQDVQNQVNVLRTDALLAAAQIAALRTDVTKLNAKSAKALHQLRVDLNRAGIALDRLTIQIASLPPAPDIAPLAARISRVAKDAAEAARQANIATAAAADQHDPEARHQAELANDAAGLAAAAARDAKARADEAHDRAVEAFNKPTPTLPPIPPFEFPRTIVLAPISTTVLAGAVTRSFTVDLPRGSYAATLQLDIDTADGVPWYGRISSAPTGIKQEMATGKREMYVIGDPFEWGGGTLTFTAQFDGYVNGVNHPITGTWRVVLEESK